MALSDKNRKLRCIPINRRKTSSVQDKILRQNSEFAKTFPLWHPHAEDMIKIPDDLAFLKSMKTDRVATMCGSDKVFKQKIERKFKRLKRQRELKNEYSKQRKEELYVKFDDLDEFNGGMKENCFVSTGITF